MRKLSPLWWRVGGGGGDDASSRGEPAERGGGAPEVRWGGALSLPELVLLLPFPVWLLLLRFFEEGSPLSWFTVRCERKRGIKGCTCGYILKLDKLDFCLHIV